MKYDEEHRYDDMIHLPHHVSPSRPRMLLFRGGESAELARVVDIAGDIFRNEGG